MNTWLEMVEDHIKVSMELDSTEMIKRFVMAGLGISFLAGSHCQEEVAAGKLATVSLGPEPMIRKLGLIYRKDKALSKAALGFIDVMLRHAGDADDVNPNSTLLQQTDGHMNDDDRTIQTSTIYVSVGNKLRVYKSVDEIPPDVRKKLEQSTTGANSVSILIADDRGREEIARAIGGLPTPVQSRLAGRLQARKVAKENSERFLELLEALGRNWPWLAERVWLSG